MWQPIPICICVCMFHECLICLYDCVFPYDQLKYHVYLDRLCYHQECTIRRTFLVREIDGKKSDSFYSARRWSEDRFIPYGIVLGSVLGGIFVICVVCGVSCSIRERSLAKKRRKVSG